MSRIDIAIKVTSSGVQEPIVTSRGPWLPNVRDIRDIYSRLEGFEGKFVTMLSFCPSGALVTVVRHQAGRVTDNIAAWIHIPSRCAVPGTEVCSLVNNVKRLLSGSRIDPAELAGLAARDYPDVKFPLEYQASPITGGYAFRTFDSYPMDEILGEARYQDYYLPYKYVFLLDRRDGINPLPGVADLSNMELSLFTTLLPPDKEELSRFRGVEALEYPGRSNTFSPFTGPVRIRRGETLALYAYRNGFERIPVTQCKAVDPVQAIHIPVDFMPEWQKKLTGSSFIITDKDSGEQIDNARITINGTDLFPSGVRLDENEAVHATVSVDAYGYEHCEKTLSPYTKEPVCISLKKAEKEYVFQLRAKTGEDAELIVRTRKPFNRHESPLKGYTLSAGNYLHHSGWEGKKSFLMGVLVSAVAALVGILVYWGLNHFITSPNDKDPVETADVTAVESLEPQGQSTTVSEDKAETVVVENDIPDIKEDKVDEDKEENKPERIVEKKPEPVKKPSEEVHVPANDDV